MIIEEDKYFWNIINNIEDIRNIQNLMDIKKAIRVRLKELGCDENGWPLKMNCDGFCGSRDETCDCKFERNQQREHQEQLRKWKK